jgi:hypothetical protein
MAGRSLADSDALDPDEESVPAMPPVRLLPEDELARLAMESPTFDAAVRLARWIAPRRPVTGDGVLELGEARRAVRELELLPEDEREAVLGGLSSADELEELDLPWSIAEELGLIDIDDDTAEPGGTLATVDTAPPEELLELWWEAAEVAVADACLATSEMLRAADGPQGAGGPSAGGSPAGGSPFPPGSPFDAAFTGDDEAEYGDDVYELDAELLYPALENLYLISALERDPGGGEPGATGGDGQVPLPVLAASLVVPDEMDAPPDEALEEVSSLMMQLDEILQLVAGTGIVEYQPVDPALVEDDGEDEDAPLPEGFADSLDDDVSRYGMVRLTPLGVYGVRRRLLAAGVAAPAIGELAEAGAGELLDAMAVYPDGAGRAEAQGWLERREPVAAARELLGACRGDDPGAPLRRLYCQQALAMLGPEIEPALREVLDDRHLGGLARVRLVEHGVSEVPEPSEEMIFWLTVDTLAAQLAEDDEELLEELVRGIPVREEPETFFSAAWQVDHPATAEVLDALGRLHPDKTVAKEARKAAFKARSRPGTAE